MIAFLQSMQGDFNVCLHLTGCWLMHYVSVISSYFPHSQRRSLRRSIPGRLRRIRQTGSEIKDPCKRNVLQVTRRQLRCRTRELYLKIKRDESWFLFFDFDLGRISINVSYDFLLSSFTGNRITKRCKKRREKMLNLSQKSQSSIRR